MVLNLLFPEPTVFLGTVKKMAYFLSGWMNDAFFLIRYGWKDALFFIWMGEVLTDG
jgi:hypothetical protein